MIILNFVAIKLASVVKSKAVALINKTIVTYLKSCATDFYYLCGRKRICQA